MHSLVKETYFDSRLFYLLGEMLKFLVSKINQIGNMILEERTSASNIFQVRCNHYYEVIPDEMEDFSERYFEIVTKTFEN